MPTDAEPDLLVDTSVAVALTVADHERHDAVMAAVAGATLGLAGHAAFETFSVLTRLPPPLRLAPQAAQRALAANFPASRFLPPDATADLLEALGGRRLAGGAVYDALVVAAAEHHGHVLATGDRRAVAVYRTFDVALRLLD